MDWTERAHTADVAPAADAVRVVAAAEAGRQADQLLGAVRAGGWEVDRADADAVGRELAWQLLQFRIDLAVGIDPLPDLIGLRRVGVTWETIARAAGVSRQSAHERWARSVAGVLDRYGTGELVGTDD